MDAPGVGAGRRSLLLLLLLLLAVLTPRAGAARAARSSLRRATKALLEAARSAAAHRATVAGAAEARAAEAWSTAAHGTVETAATAEMAGTGAHGHALVLIGRVKGQHRRVTRQTACVRTHRRDPVGRVAPGRKSGLLIDGRAASSTGRATSRPGRGRTARRRSSGPSAGTLDHADSRALARATALAELRHEVGVLGVEDTSRARRAAGAAAHRPSATRSPAITRHVALRATVVADDVGGVVALLGAVPFLRASGEARSVRVAEAGGGCKPAQTHLVAEVAAVLADLVLVVAERSVEGGKLTELVALVVILGLGKRGGLQSGQKERASAREAQVRQAYTKDARSQ